MKFPLLRKGQPSGWSSVTPVPSGHAFVQASSSRLVVSDQQQAEEMLVAIYMIRLLAGKASILGARSLVARWEERRLQCREHPCGKAT